MAVLESFDKISHRASNAAELTLSLSSLTSCQIWLSSLGSDSPHVEFDVMQLMMSMLRTSSLMCQLSCVKNGRISPTILVAPIAVAST